MATAPDQVRPSLLVLVRHGATDWSRSGRHTGRTDLRLDEGGVSQAVAIGERLAGTDFAAVFTSPLTRARETCALAGLAAGAVVDDDLVEWDYGEYEGRTTADIRRERPVWQLFDDGCPGGESIGEVGRRAECFIARLAAAPPGGTVAVFSHGHLLRILAARWVGAPADFGRHLVLDAGSVSVLGSERETPALVSWNG